MTEHVSVKDALERPEEIIAEREESEANAQPVAVPEIAARADGESGWDYRQRKYEAWRAIPQFATFVDGLAAQVRSTVTAFVAEGNAVPGFTPEGVTYKALTVTVQNDAGEWVETQARVAKKRAASTKVSYVAMANLLADALKANGSS